MKLLLNARRLRMDRCQVAFTLTELMVSMALFTIVIGGIIYSHITGLKMYELTRAKLGASDSIRLTLGRLTSEVRSAQKIAIGTGSASSFTEAAAGSNQEGDAIQIYRADYHPTANSNAFIRYFRDASSSQLYRKVGGNSAATVVAEYISNPIVFMATDHQGVVLTDNDNNKVIAVVLQLYQLRYPQVTIGSNEFFDYFQISSHITRRSI